MTLNDLALQKLANWRPAQPRQPLTFDHSELGWRIDVLADAVDTLGARLWEVTLRRTSPDAAPAPLDEQADRIAGRVTGLMEPLRLVEVDGPRGVAQLRS